MQRRSLTYSLNRTASDSNEARTLRTAAYTDPTGMTIESCIAFCSPSAFVYAGLEFARVCSQTSHPERV